MPRKPFYAEGIQFECQGSGKCCTSRGSYGFVYLTDADQKRFAKYFGITKAQFLKQYCGEKGGHVHLIDPPENKGDCMFLKKNQCSAYVARPEHCRTWPFWPENMNPKTWNNEIKTFCPGVGKGKIHSFEEIKAVLDSQKEMEF